MARLTSKTNSLERISSYGQVIACPVCSKPFMLKDTKDGDQAYWCHTCERGWRAGHLPPEARRAKAKMLLEASLEPASNGSEPNLEVKSVSESSKAHEPRVLGVSKPRLKSSHKPKFDVSSQSGVVLGVQQSLFEVSR
jgi:uncharacterized protein YbaR (Trm112 family)